MKTVPAAIIREVNAGLDTAGVNIFFGNASEATVFAFPELNTEDAATDSRAIPVAKERRNTYDERGREAHGWKGSAS